MGLGGTESKFSSDMIGRLQGYNSASRRGCGCLARGMSMGAWHRMRGGSGEWRVTSPVYMGRVGEGTSSLVRGGMCGVGKDSFDMGDTRYRVQWPARRNLVMQIDISVEYTCWSS